MGDAFILTRARHQLSGRTGFERLLTRSENIEVQVYEVARVFRIRIDDLKHPDAWFELTVEVESEPVPSKATA